MGFDPREYWERRLSHDLSVGGVGFQGLGRRYNEWLYRIRRHVFLRRMRALGLNFDRALVLDVGSGSGFYVDAWKRLGVRGIVGCDLTGVAVRELRQKYPEDQFHQVDIGGDLGVLGGYRFDLISAFDVLFHIVDDHAFERALRNISSLLKPGGLLIFSDNFLHGETLRGPHQVSRSLRDIERTLAGTGFQIVQHVPMLFLMNSPVDSSNRALLAFWQGLSKFVSLHEAFGFMLGAMMYPVELGCVSLSKGSPTTEMMICKKAQ